MRADADLDEDRVLLDAFRRGERWAQEHVYRLHAPGVLRYLRRGFSFASGGRSLRFRGLQSGFQLEDWVHDVFLRAFDEKARQSYDGLRPFGPYLERIARNLVLDELRRKEHRLRVHVESEVEPESSGVIDAPTAPSSPEQYARDRQLEAHLATFVDALPERERQVYEARFVKRREQKDIAAELRLTESKVKTSEKRIRERFRAYLIEHGWLEGADTKGSRHD